MADKETEKHWIPQIDIAPLTMNKTDGVEYSKEEQEKVIAQVKEALHKWGFFLATNHNINTTKESLKQMEIFFRQSKERKYSVKRTVTNSRGFADDELTKRKKDQKELYDIGPPNSVPPEELSAAARKDQLIDGFNQWPEIHDGVEVFNDDGTSTMEVEADELRDFRYIMEHHYENCHHLSKILMNHLLQPFLEGNEQYQNILLDKHTSYLRLNYYSPDLSSAAEEKHSDSGVDEVLGISRHTDAGLITILLQDDGYEGIVQIYVL